MSITVPSAAATIMFGSTGAARSGSRKNAIVHKKSNTKNQNAHAENNPKTIASIATRAKIQRASQKAWRRIKRAYFRIPQTAGQDARNRGSWRLNPNHNIWARPLRRVQLVAQTTGSEARDIYCFKAFFSYPVYVGRLALLLWRKFKRKFRSKKLVPESPQRKNTTRRRSTSWKVSKQFASGRECSSETLTNADCITWFTKFSIIRSTNISRDFAQRSKWSSTSMDRSRCATTVAVFRLMFILKGKCRPSNWCWRMFMPAENSDR